MAQTTIILIKKIWRDKRRVGFFVSANLNELFYHVVVDAQAGFEFGFRQIETSY